MEQSAWPPLHPMLVHFPIALITVSFICDFLSKVFMSASLRSAGWWCLVAGGVTAAGAIPLGYFDMNRASLSWNSHQFVAFHLLVGWMLLGCIAALILWRASFRAKPELSIGGGYLLVAMLVAGLVLFQGWYGGEMVYSHGTGVAAAGQGTRSAAQAAKPLLRIRQALQAVPGFRSTGSEDRAGHANEPAGGAKPDPSQTTQRSEEHRHD